MLVIISIGIGIGISNVVIGNNVNTVSSGCRRLNEVGQYWNCWLTRLLRLLLLLRWRVYLGDDHLMLLLLLILGLWERNWTLRRRILASEVRRGSDDQLLDNVLESALEILIDPFLK